MLLNNAKKPNYVVYDPYKTRYITQFNNMGCCALASAVANMQKYVEKYELIAKMAYM